VFVCYDVNDPTKLYAVKKLKYTVARIAEDVPKLLREIDFLSNTHYFHDNIIKLTEYFATPAGIPEYIVMEYFDGKELYEQIKSDVLNLKQCKAVFLQVLKALAHLHAQNPPIMHRDIKPENILAKNVRGPETPEVRLIDFGLAKKLLSEVNTSNPRLQAYFAPETLGEGQVPYTTKADSFSVGVSMFASVRSVVAAFPTFNSPTYHMTLDKWPTALKAQSPLSSGLKIIIEGLVAYNPEDRWTTQQAIDYMESLPDE